MIQKKHGKGKGLPDEGLGRYIRFAFIPLLVIILIVLIIRMDSPTDGETAAASASYEETEAEESSAAESAGEESAVPASEPAEDSSETDSEAIPESQSADAIDVSALSLVQDEIPALTALVTSYCEAREDCDAELMASLFGVTDMSEEELEAETQRLELVKASIKSYENISCYSVEGPEEGSYVIFPYYEIRYRSSDVLVPTLGWGYVRTGSDGSLYMVQEPDDATVSYIQAVSGKAEVKALTDQVQAARQEAIASDSALQEIYSGGSGSEVILHE